MVVGFAGTNIRKFNTDSECFGLGDDESAWGLGSSGQGCMLMHGCHPDRDLDGCVHSDPVRKSLCLTPQTARDMIEPEAFYMPGFHYEGATVCVAWDGVAGSMLVSVNSAPFAVVFPPDAVRPCATAGAGLFPAIYGDEVVVEYSMCGDLGLAPPSHDFLPWAQVLPPPCPSPQSGCLVHSPLT